jgi:hypothetical protein
MSRPHEILKSLPLTKQILLTRIGNRHIASIHAEARLISRRREIVMRESRIPDDEISRFGTDFEPFAALFGKPFHSGFFEAVPFVGPLGDSFFGGELLVVFFAEEVGSFADDQATVIGSVGEEIDETNISAGYEDAVPLKATEAGFFGVLILVRPRFVGGEISTTTN